MLAQFIQPMLASLVEQPPDGDWMHEIITSRQIKERLLARVRAKRVPLPKGMEAKPDAKWLEPGVLVRGCATLRGEENLRHASVGSVTDSL